MTSGIEFDLIMIPIAGEKDENIERVERAVEEQSRSWAICGFDKNLNNYHEEIYKKLRQAGVGPLQIYLDGNSRDTLGNVIGLAKIINKTDSKKIGVASYFSHICRIMYFADRAKGEGIIDKDIEIIALPTEQTWRELLYGTFGLFGKICEIGYYGGIEEAQQHPTGNFGNFIKKKI